MFQESRRKFPDMFRNLLIIGLRVILVAALLGAGWFIYRELPTSSSGIETGSQGSTSLQIVMEQLDNSGSALDVQVNLYPIDIVAVSHEFFTEPRAGKRFDDFLKERMKGRSPVNARLDKQGQATVVLTPGKWWLHTRLNGDEQLEWRLPVTVRGAKQTVELTPQNAYTRSKTF